jgi:Zn-dependent peptidase ImmA (M78 family)
MTTTLHHRQPSVMASLRGLVPERPLTFWESHRIAELQAVRLLQQLGCTSAPVPLSALTSLPRLDVRLDGRLRSSGATTWRKGLWRIRINASEPHTRMRFTVAHEIKHVLDASLDDVIYARVPTAARERHIEAICNHFAANVLMPRVWLKRLWFGGHQDVADLAWRFDVSQEAMRIRLQVIGLLERTPRSGEVTQLGRLAVRQARRTRERKVWYRVPATASIGEPMMGAIRQAPVLTARRSP